jgi:acyl transferase domain-containing protein
MAARLPGARNVEEFWHNLCAGEESISRFREQELLAAGVDRALLAQSSYVSAGATLADVDLFDAEFFGVTPQDAAALDPQHRLFLECAWEAFESSGYDPERLSERVGVYASSSLSGYAPNLFLSSSRLESARDVSALISLDKDFLATRVSYKLNLRGPSLSVQTACSSSLVAVHLACQALLVGECELALAGGACIRVPQERGYLYQEGGIASPDGHCRAFDKAAMGTVPGNGVGVVLLKRLEDALAARDHVVAVIKGSAINNDGRGKIGFAAPSVEGQVSVIRDAHAAANTLARSIGYVEAHGTGTPLGDPIELTALARAFGTRETGFCALGSVKTNIGHLDVAAGIAGLLKACLVLSRGKIPPSLHFDSPNPAVDLPSTPFYVANELIEWPSGETLRRAGVSSFGIGGTNAHVVLEEAPRRPADEVVDSSEPELLVLSARSPAALRASEVALAAHLRLESGGRSRLSDVAHTLRVGRRAFPYRSALVCSGRDDAVRKLLAREAASPASAASESRPVVFVFCSEVACQANFHRAFYEHEPVFRGEVDECARLLEGQFSIDLRARLSSVSPEDDVREDAVIRAFVYGYAFARLWMSRGVRPRVTIGIGVGEYVSACVGGTLSLADALRLAVLRGRLKDPRQDDAASQAFHRAVAATSLREPSLPWIATGASACITSAEALEHIRRHR